MRDRPWKCKRQKLLFPWQNSEILLAGATVARPNMYG